MHLEMGQIADHSQTAAQSRENNLVAIEVTEEGVRRAMAPDHAFR
jgi:hypothetical protein